MKLKELLKEVFNLREHEYQDVQSIFELEQFDSMNHMLLVQKLEETYSVELTGDEIISLKTIEDIKNILRQKAIAEDAI